MFPFNIQGLSHAVNREPNLYSRIGQDGVFTRQGTPDTYVTLALRDGEIVLLDAVSRDGKNQQLTHEADDFISFHIPSFKLEDVLTPNDIQGITAFAEGPLRPQQMSEAYSRRLGKVRKPYDMTFEFLRINGIKGRIVNPKDQSVMYNLHDAFGITQKTIDFDLSNDSADIRGAEKELSDYMADNLLGETSTGNIVYCDKGFFDGLENHPNYEKYLLGHAAALAMLATTRQNPTSPNPRRRLMLGDTVFEQYQGKAKNSAGTVVDFIAAGKGHAIPVGTMDTFREYDAPPNRMDAVNQAPNEEIHIYPEELGKQKGIEIEGEAAKICLAARPELCVEVS